MVIVPISTICLVRLVSKFDAWFRRSCVVFVSLLFMAASISFQLNFVDLIRFGISLDLIFLTIWFMLRTLRFTGGGGSKSSNSAILWPQSGFVIAMVSADL